MQEARNAHVEYLAETVEDGTVIDDLVIVVGDYYVVVTNGQLGDAVKGSVAVKTGGTLTDLEVNPTDDIAIYDYTTVDCTPAA